MKSEQQKRPVLIGGIILSVLIITGLVFLFYWIIFSGYVSTDDAAIDGIHVSISSKIMGRINSLDVDEGDKVNAGDLLVQLDDTDLHAQEAQSIASLNYAKQNLTLAKINLDKNQNDFQRTKNLFKAGVATKETYDHAVNALDASNAQYSIAEAQIDTANAQLGIIKAQILNTKITAPITGIIAKRFIMPGEVVQPGQAIFTVNDLNHVWVIANFEETKISKIHNDQIVKISVDAYPNFNIKGRVALVFAAIIPPPFTIGESTKTTQKIPVKILFDQIPDSKILRPGMSVEVKIKVN